MPSRSPIICSKELKNTGVLDCEINHEVNNSVKSSNESMSVVEVEKFKCEMMDLCQRVLDDGEATFSQEKMFKTLVKNIVFDTLNLNILPHN